MNLLHARRYFLRYREPQRYFPLLFLCENAHVHYYRHYHCLRQLIPRLQRSLLAWRCCTKRSQTRLEMHALPRRLQKQEAAHTPSLPPLLQPRLLK